MKMMKVLGVCCLMPVSAVMNHHTSSAAMEVDDDMSSELRATVEALADAWLKPDGNTPSVSQVMRAVGSKIDVQHAVEKLQKKKPST